MNKLEKSAVINQENEGEFELSDKKIEALKSVRDLVEKSPDILAAKIYGSWICNNESVDLDVAILAPSNNGVVAPEVYQELKSLRQKTAEASGEDIDLVPHTEDELDDLRSPFYHPRYNSALVKGEDIKGRLDIKSSTKVENTFEFADIAVNILYDTRAICRRQLIRSLSEGEARIFVSKLLHGPGNILTCYSCKEHLPYISNPSNWEDSLKQVDAIFGVNSEPIIDFLRQYEHGRVDFEIGCKLLNWYECLIGLILRPGNESPVQYNNFCARFNSEKPNDQN